MHFLVTAGNTQVLIDRVRCITNIFTGRTGAAIALEAHRRGHHVRLLTSHPEAAAELRGDAEPISERWRIETYRTFDELRDSMALHVSAGNLSGIVHCAAVSDYLAGGVYSPTSGTRFDPEEATWRGEPPTLVDRGAGKVKSDEPELWLRLVRAPKLVDMIRRDWGFRGPLVKFKLEVGVSDEQLLEIAEKSRRQSSADLMVANTLEGAAEWAFVGQGPRDCDYQRVPRAQLAARVIDALELLTTDH